MSLHRSTSSASSSSTSSTSFSSTSSTILLHPLEIHFLAEPYGPSQLSPSQSTPSPATPTQSSHPPVSPPVALDPHQAPGPQKATPGKPSPFQDAWKAVASSAPFGTGPTDGTQVGASRATSAPITPTSPGRPLPYGSSLPKIQVCGRGGLWWALNASVLQLYRDLNARGHCSCVRAEIVSLNKVPDPLQTAMVFQRKENTENRKLISDPSRSTKRGYNRLTASEDDTNCNSSQTLQKSAHGGTPTSPITPTVGVTPTSDFDWASTGSNSVVESSSDYDNMSQSDDSDDDDDEALTCNVCDRAFPTTRLLASHQTRKRHYGCSTCENVFPNLMSLETHKEESSHWSDDDIYLNDDEEQLQESYEEEEEENEEEEREKLL